VEEVFFGIVAENKKFEELMSSDNLFHLFEFIIAKDDDRLSMFLSHLQMMNKELEQANMGLRNGLNFNNLLLK
jgi:hypothetical protein